MTYVDHFYLVNAGQGRWIVRHQASDAFAGTILRTPDGYLLTDERSRGSGVFATLDDALRGLYADA